MKVLVKTIKGRKKITDTADISELNILGKGATGTVYKTTFQDKTYAAKIYHEKTSINLDKLNAMLNCAPDNLYLDTRGEKIPQFGWPVALLKNENNQYIGYFMPYVDAKNSFTLDHYYDKTLLKKLNSVHEEALTYKLEIARNLCQIISDLHIHKHHFIDFKPQNIRVFKETHIVALLDCDGFSIFDGSNRFSAELISADYIAPEAFSNKIPPSQLGEMQDRYALATILFQLLNNGTHPFQGIIKQKTIEANTNDEKSAAGLYPHGIMANQNIKPRPQSIHNLFDHQTRVLFDRAFLSTHVNDRPSAVEWYKHFDYLLSNKLILQCEKVPQNLRHLRFKDKGCPTCYLENLPKFSEVKSKTTLNSINQGKNSFSNKPYSHPNTTTQRNLPKKNDNFFGVVLVIIIVVIMIYYLGASKNSSVQPENQSAETSSSQTTKTELTDIEELPSLNANILNENQIRYCLAEEKRLNFIEAVFDRNSNFLNNKLRKANSDKNSRCSINRMDSVLLSEISVQISSWEQRLNAEAQMRLDLWIVEESNSLPDNEKSNTNSDSKPFDTNEKF
jgi:hypothetical protein